MTERSHLRVFVSIDNQHHNKQTKFLHDQLQVQQLSSEYCELSARLLAMSMIFSKN